MKAAIGSLQNEYQISITRLSNMKTVRISFDQKSKNSLPKFNKDNLFYTPAFQNKEDIIKNDFDRKVHKYLHNDRIKI